jgi:hypothetical protein
VYWYVVLQLYYANPKDLVEVREIPSSLRSVDTGSAQSLRQIESNSSVGLAQRNKGSDSADSLLATSTNAIAEG